MNKLLLILLIILAIGIVGSGIIFAYNNQGENLEGAQEPEPNPSITIRLDRIGVHDNRESFPRGAGDVYVNVEVSDGNGSAELRFPSGDGQTYSLDKDETVNIGATIYSTDEVGDFLALAVVGYESDGAITTDDFLGSYERTWKRDNNWGIGKYEDIALEDERGVRCLRLWFTIESPMKPPSVPKAPVTTPEPAPSSTPSPLPSQPSSTGSKVEFEFAVTGVSGSGFSRTISAQLKNIGTDDAHNVWAKVEVFSQESRIKLSGEDFLSVDIGLLKSGAAVTKQVPIEFSLMDGIKISQNGANFVLTVNSDENTQELYYDYQP
ncbi:hypothetical protein ACFLVF_01165 [Chloroflexota bacterium]